MLSGEKWGASKFFYLSVKFYWSKSFKFWYLSIYFIIWKRYITQQNLVTFNIELKEKLVKKIGRDNRSIEKSTSRRGARQHVYDYLKSHPCIKCGESDPRVLQFNHINPDEKLETVSNIMRRGLTQVMKEIEKCEVLCANCHSKHTADQQNWYKDLII